MDVASNRGDLLRQVDADRAPGDAATAPDAAGSAKLIDPRRQFVREPLTVAGANRRSHGAAVHVAEIEVEARIPAPLAINVVPLQIADVLDAAAKAGRANHRAIGARQAAVGDIRPARMLQVGKQEVVDVAGIDLAGLLSGLLPADIAFGKLGGGRRSAREAGEHFPADVAARLHQKAAGKFCQREIKPRAASWAGFH